MTEPTPTIQHELHECCAEPIGFTGLQDGGRFTDITFFGPGGSPEYVGPEDDLDAALAGGEP